MTLELIMNQGGRTEMKRPLYIWFFWSVSCIVQDLLFQSFDSRRDALQASPDKPSKNQNDAKENVCDEKGDRAAAGPQHDHLVCVDLPW